MARTTQMQVLAKAMTEAGQTGMSRGEIAMLLNVKANSVPIYIYGLRKFCKADIGAVKNGKQIVAYVLNNPETLNVHGDRRVSGGKVVAKKATVAKAKVGGKVNPVAEKQLAPKVREDKAVAFDRDLEIASIGDREFSDLRESLGLGSFGSSWD